MLAELLKERFGLVSHSETAMKSGYLLKTGKNGPRVKPAEPDDSQPGDHRTTDTQDRFKRDMAPRAGEPGIALFRMPRATMDKVADAFAKWMGVPVADRTGLAGQFNVELRFAGHDDESGVEAARQLGLELVTSHSEIQTVLVEGLRRVPLPN